MSTSPDIAIDVLVRRAGFLGPEAEDEARRVLIATGLTRQGKQRMAQAKVERATQVLHDALAPRCASAVCRKSVLSSIRTVLVPAEACPVCCGSNTRRALNALAEGLRAAGIFNLLVLGGVAEQHRELTGTLSAAGIAVHCVDGAGAVPVLEARAAVARATLVAVWASTPLPHKVSRRYTDEARRLGVRQITVPRRGLEALASELLRAVGQAFG